MQGYLDWAPMNNAPATGGYTTSSGGYAQPGLMPQQYRTMYGYSQQQRQPFNNLLRVTGPESAKAYSLGPNSKVVLFDADNPVFYLKSTDDSGFATLRTFDFTERPVEAPAVQQLPTQPVPDSLQKEVDEIRSDISDLKELLEGLVG